MEPSGTRLALRDVYRYSGLGCTLAAAILLFTAGGWLLDRWLGITPVFTVIGALVGAALGSVSIYRRLFLSGSTHEDEQR